MKWRMFCGSDLDAFVSYELGWLSVIGLFFLLMINYDFYISQL